MTRPVTVFEYWRPEGSAYNTPWEFREIGKGQFHQFSIDCEWCDSENGVGNFSTAIVEMPDGEVKVVHADMIRFDD